MLYNILGHNYNRWLAVVAFGVRGAAGLQQYLTAQRQRLTALASPYAQPLVTFIREASTEADQRL